MDKNRSNRRSKNVTVITHEHFHFYDDTKLIKLLNKISKQNLKIMSKQEELDQRLADLEASISAEKEQVAAEMEKLTAEVARLNEIIATGSDPVALQASIDKIGEIITLVNNIVVPPEKEEEA